MHTSRAVRVLIFIFGCLFVGALVSTEAGSIALEWDPAPGANGYRVYYGTEPGRYSGAHDVGPVTSTVVTGLSDCTTWFLAVKAYGRTGESPEFSNEVGGWPRPTVTSVEPVAEIQGARFTLDVAGTNFRPGVVASIDGPRVFLDSTTALSCNHLQIAASVEPTSGEARPAKIGPYTLTILNPDDVFGVGPGMFEVLVNPARFDVDKRPPSDGRLDGHDTIWLSRLFATHDGQRDFRPGSDFDGDGWVDGTDLAYLVANLGRCWNGTDWSIDACPE